MKVTGHKGDEKMPDRIPMVDLKEELRLIRTPLLEEITEVLDSGDYILGEKGKKLEEMVAGYVGASYGIGVANGTDALQLSLASLNVGPGDEVITTPFTFFADRKSTRLNSSHVSI